MDSYRMETPADADEIRAILQEAVQARGTQKDLAEYMGMSDVHISRLMTGRCALSLPNLFAILDYVDMTLILSGASEG